MSAEFNIEVYETVLVRKLYVVTAASEAEARKKAEVGDTITKTPLNAGEVRHRCIIDQRP